MKIKSDFVKNKIYGKTVIIPVGEMCKKFHGMVELNETAEIIWDCLSDGLDKTTIVEKLADKYNVTKEKASSDVDAVIEKLDSAGFIDRE